MIKLRDYKQDDQDKLLTLINDLQDYGVSIDPIKRVRRGPLYGRIKLRKVLNDVKNQEGKIILAYDEKTNEVIGFIVGFILIQTEEKKQEIVPSKTGYINRLYVKETQRRKRIGTQLLEAIEKHFQSCGCDGIWIEADAYNPTARNLYEARGYIQREIHLLKKI